MFSKEQKQKVIKLYRNKSLTLNQIANLCDMSLGFVKKLVKVGIESGQLRPRNELKVGKPCVRKFTDEQLAQIAVDYYENKMSTAQLIGKWQVHPMQLQRVRNRYGGKYGKKVMGGEFRVKAVQQFDKDGTLIAEFPNGHQASVETGINYQTINRCCNGVYKSSGGFIWQFKENKNGN